MPRIQAVVVLYNMHFEASPTCMALQAAFLTQPDFADSVDLFLADNSKQPQTLPPSFCGTYLHDGSNPGLARRYNQALKRATETGAEWLLLFDQDTKPTPEYLSELLQVSLTLEAQPEVAIVVPKLVMDGRIMSPHGPRYRGQAHPVGLETYGVFPGALRAFNSGALLRVSALQAIGGFPEEYWLDYLDHATFHRLQERGLQVFVMHAVLEHELSDARPNQPQNPVRLANRLRAEERFYAEHGSQGERLQHRFDLIRQVIGWGRRGHFAQAMVRLKVLLRLN